MWLQPFMKLAIAFVAPERPHSEKPQKPINDSVASHSEDFSAAAVGTHAHVGESVCSGHIGTSFSQEIWDL
jgi:hypothetical protein